MPDNITFNTIPLEIRTGGVYLEVDNSKALGGSLVAQPRRMLFIGNKLATGTAAANTLQRINNPGEAAAFFGRGSVLHEMLRGAREANKESDMWAIALDDLAGGVQATKTLTLTGPATAGGTLYLRINGELIPVGVASADTATNIAAAVVTAVNAYLDAPVTAAAAAGVVTFTARHKGVFGNDIDVRVNYQRDEALPAGVSAVVATGVTGTGNPDVATALAAISTEKYYTIVMPYTDITNLDKVKTELTSRFGGMDMRTGHLFTGYAGTQSGLTTFGAGRNNVHETVYGVKKPPQGAYNWAARMAAVVEFNGAIDPARPFKSLPVPGLLAPQEADRFLRQERELLLKDGISTFTVGDDGTVYIEQVITTYQTNPQGIEDASFLMLNTKWTVDFMRYSFQVAVALDYPRHKLADDGTNFAEGQAIATPLMIKGTLIATARKLEQVGILEGFEDFKRKLNVVRSMTDRNRVNAIIPPNCVNQFNTFAAAVQFIL
ncbi:MAG: phage tail sheath C-terminal domain-containing protein [Rhodoferax sp.]|nr:phage tail sheath C-terminal domain-containing protein [Rhodoferax sp.]